MTTATAITAPYMPSPETKDTAAPAARATVRRNAIGAKRPCTCRHAASLAMERRVRRPERTKPKRDGLEPARNRIHERFPGAVSPASRRTIDNDVLTTRSPLETFLSDRG
ncbi:hypothetical protein GCM10027203_63640 [Nonomuraea fastidiosa]